jgi:hypothetical protein
LLAVSVNKSSTVIIVLYKGVYFMDNVMAKATGLLNGIIDIGIKLIAAGVILQILFGAAVPFLAIDVTASVIKFVGALGSQGLVGLAALGVIYWSFTKK